MKQTGVTLAALVGSDQRLDDLRGSSPDRVIAELLDCLVRSQRLVATAVDPVRRAIAAREREGSTGIGRGIAIPHMKECTHVREISAVFGRSRAGVDYGATDGELVHVFFLLLTPPGADSEHVRLMRRIVSLSRDRNTLHHLIHADPLDNLGAIFEDVDSRIQ